MSGPGMQRCTGFTLREEGGFVDNPRDPGGATNMGITLATLRAWREDDELGVEAIRSLGKSEALAIYAAKFWNVIRGDDLPVGLDLLVFDFAVTSSPERSTRLLQRALGIREDGYLGDITLEKAHGAAGFNDRGLLLSLTSKQGLFYQALRTYATFGRGWMARLGRREGSAFQFAGLPAPL